MGYAATTVVVLGIEINQEDSSELLAAMETRFKAMSIDSSPMELGDMVEALGYPTGRLECVWAGDGGGLAQPQYGNVQ